MKVLSYKVGFWIVGLLIGHALFSYCFESYYSKAPLKAQIDLSKTFEREFEIRVPMAQTYEVELRFEREGRDFEYLKSVLGDMGSRNKFGTPLKVNWVLSSGGETFAENQLVAVNSCGWSNKQVYHCLGKFKVPSGKYKFTLSISDPDEVFEQLKTSISINYNFKNAHTWQTAYMFWAMLFNIFVAPILGGVILLVMAIKTLNK
ncbi:hypothetical protein L9G16_07040 [Shewanella sp. A25]|nr:hypothetical protein [Shewanella shenzhenensis]